MSTLHILHLDDDPVIRRMVSRVLGRAGIRVDGAATIAEAEDLLTQRRYDALVVDYHLGGAEDGMQFIERRRGSAPGERMLLFTGSLDPRLEARAHALGVVRCVSKGARSAELIDSVRVAAGRSGTIRVDEVLDDAATGTS